ncbi:hypothetical protein BpHYR1_026268 [Brachionus plicatilis]|uniref:Uncharacterized protein n=1 Tax=Brachionus plicatilis TaxID=10195 RepID=A0A3M7Q919_BRAPC|nr:hypothetical protein BpHYR1_026268 [Brachionus plicatilis]
MNFTVPFDEHLFFDLVGLVNFLKATGLWGRATQRLNSLGLKILRKIAKFIGCSFLFTCCSSCTLFFTTTIASIFFFIPFDTSPAIGKSLMSDASGGAILAISSFESKLASASTLGDLVIWDSQSEQIKVSVNSGILVDLKYLNKTKLVSINRDSFMLIHTHDGCLILELNLTQFGSLNSLNIYNSENIIIGTSGGSILFVNSTGNITALVHNGASLISALQLTNGDLVSADAQKEIKIRKGQSYERVNRAIGIDELGAIKKLDAYFILEIEYIFYCVGINLYVIDSFSGQMVNTITAISNIVSFKFFFNSSTVVVANSRSVSYFNVTDGALLNETKFDSEILCLDTNSESIFVGEGNGNVKVVDANQDSVSCLITTISVQGIVSNNLNRASHSTYKLQLEVYNKF